MMKDDDQDSYRPTHTKSLSMCQKSSQCLDFVDELNGNATQNGAVPEDEQDAQDLEQLRIHVPTCATCTATLVNANKMVAQQRLALRVLLEEGEQKVPSTHTQIMAALRQGQGAAHKIGANNHHEVTSIVPFLVEHNIETPRPRRIRKKRYSAFAIAAVAAILIASFGLFSYTLPRHSATSSSAAASHPAAPTSVATLSTSIVPGVLSTWSSVVIMYQLNGTMVIANYDPLHEKSAVLATSLYAETTVNGVSHDGHMLLYSTYDGFRRSYFLYPQSTTDAFFTTPEKGGSAIWSTDDRSLFINTAQGVTQIDVRTHHTSQLLPTLASTSLLNYRDGYLYFVKGYQGRAYSPEGILNRANVTTGSVQQVTDCERGANFWLSPGGIRVYYTCPTQDTALHTVSSDGISPVPSVFRANTNVLIGYRDDGSPLTVTSVTSRQQVVRCSLNTTVQDTVVLNDIAPGAGTLTADAVAVAPGGYTLVAKGLYGTSKPTEQFWYGDLVTGKTQRLLLPPNARNVHAIGWDRLQVG